MTQTFPSSRPGTSLPSVESAHHFVSFAFSDPLRVSAS
jgi:hypothetical protein